MELAKIQLPRLVPVPRVRPPQENIPPTPQQRERIRDLARAFLAEKRPVPPLSLAELRGFTEEFALRHGISHVCSPTTPGVLLNSELWRDRLAAVPFQRRLLLLPKCLRIEDRCPAPFDEFGLLCKQCGLCSIQELQAEAERLGYAVLVAEGSAIVTGDPADRQDRRDRRRELPFRAGEGLPLRRVGGHSGRCHSAAAKRLQGRYGRS